ncbi:hypothetical protein FA15DRAFT_673391 [Coprinopsis marcescibilis]|uniref:DUF6533 domain-containing protein n=1 Tax=Coprinopsis marcescibilis TaxID=230819 RepID=A0A5C3KK26_COPMA|nr:hypothetical protein FA15DRAFT_673391 [Coprinopsis marcescibilis]
MLEIGGVSVEDHLWGGRIMVDLPLACWVILLLEYLDTFRLEVELIWPAKWGLVKLLYVLDRFLPFVILPFVGFYNITANPSSDFCRILFAIPCMGIIACIFIAEAILYLRVFALSGRSRTILVVILINGIVVVATCCALLARYIALATWDIPRPPGVSGCKGTFTDGKLVMIGYGTTLYSGILVAVLCVYFGIRLYWSRRPGRIITIFYRDGTMYFIALSVMSITNVVIAANLPTGFRFLMAPFQGVLTSSLSIRMVLRLRQGAREDMGLTTVKVPDIEFTPETSGIAMDVPRTRLGA